MTLANGTGDIFRALEGAVEPMVATFDLADKLAVELDQPADKVIRALRRYATQQRHGQDVDANFDLADALLRDPHLPERRLPFVKDGTEPEPLRFVKALDLPDEPVEYIYEDLLVAGGTSLLAGAPKAGKSHLARCLALSAARGAAYLGRRMSGDRRPVLLVSLEEAAGQVRGHLAKMGMTEADEDLLVYVPEGPPPRNLAARLAVTVDRVRPSLVVLDTIQKLLRIGDVNDYGAVVTALEPLAALARVTSAHVMALHHTRKSGGQGGAEVLGSTGFAGGFDTLLMLRCDEGGQRTLYSRNRSGEDLPETLLQLDEDGWVRTVGTKAAAETRSLEQDILDFVADKGEAVGADAVISGLSVGRNAGKAALSKLVEDGLLKCEGDGRRGSPFLYSVLHP